MGGNVHFKIDWASLQSEGNLPFLLCFTLYWRANSKYKPPGGLYSEERFNGGFFCVTILGGLYLEGLIHGGAYFRNFTVQPNLVPGVLSLLSRGMRENSGNESLNVAQETLQTILQCSLDRLDPTPLLSLHMRRRCSALSPRKFVAKKQRITSQVLAPITKKESSQSWL